MWPQEDHNPQVDNLWRELSKTLGWKSWESSKAGLCLRNKAKDFSNVLVSELIVFLKITENLHSCFYIVFICCYNVPEIKIENIFFDIINSEVIVFLNICECKPYQMT